jgi:threonine synthase
MKTLAFEISEQLSRDKNFLKSNFKTPWCVPDWYIQAVSGGLGPVGVLKGFEELKIMGITDRMPSAASIQVEGCAPMVHAWKNNLENPVPITVPHTNIATLATGDPGRNYSLLKQRMLSGGGGTFESVTDEEAFRAIHVLAKMEGLSMEPASAVAFAGLIKLVRAGKIKSDEIVVVNLTGHTFPVEKMILGDNWLKDVEIPIEPRENLPEEGLLSALSRISPNRFSTILIVDDNQDSRRLIRRILQSQGNFVIHEAENGYEGIRLAEEKNPDVMILDLMMPQMDGFSVIDTLKSKEKTSKISIIVVTAKDLSEAEKLRLRGRIHSLMQKGQFLNNEFLDELETLLE